jgi:hypothetical protein
MHQRSALALLVLALAALCTPCQAQQLQAARSLLMTEDSSPEAEPGRQRVRFLLSKAPTSVKKPPPPHKSPPPPPPILSEMWGGALVSDADSNYTGSNPPPEVSCSAASGLILAAAHLPGRLTCAGWRPVHQLGHWHVSGSAHECRAQHRLLAVHGAAQWEAPGQGHLHCRVSMLANIAVSDRTGACDAKGPYLEEGRHTL